MKIIMNNLNSSYVESIIKKALDESVTIRQNSESVGNTWEKPKRLVDKNGSLGLNTIEDVLSTKNRNNM